MSGRRFALALDDDFEDDYSQQGSKSSNESKKKDEIEKPIMIVTVSNIKQILKSISNGDNLDDGNEENSIKEYRSIITTNNKNELKKPLNLYIEDSKEIKVGDVLKITIEKENIFNNQKQYEVATYTHMIDVFDEHGNVIGSNYNGYERWLKLNCNGVGDVMASKIVNNLKKIKHATINYILEHPNVFKEAVSDLKISDTIINEILQKWDIDKIKNELYAYLVKFRYQDVDSDKPIFNKAVINNMISTHGNAIKDVLKNNPWSLVKEIRGLSFKTIDSFSVINKCDMESSARIDACVDYCLSNMIEKNGGHCYASIEAITKFVSKELNMESEKITNYLKESSLDVSGKNTTVDSYKYFYVNDNGNIYRSDTYNNEIITVDRIKQMLSMGPRLAKKDAEKLVDVVSAYQGLKLDDSQYNAAVMSLMYPVVVMTGGPGVGKSTIQKVVMNCLKKLNKKVSACCPTGKGARRQEETSGFPATTIHRQLEYNPNDDYFKRDEFNPIDADSIIVDEASMEDIFLASNQIQAVKPESQIIYVGDINQIPSVGSGQVLKDFIMSGLIPICVLEKTHRQSNQSGIPTIAKKIIEGDSLSPNENLRGVHIVEISNNESLNNKVVELIHKEISKRGISFDRDVMILSPVKDGEDGVKKLNQILKDTFNHSLMNRTTKINNNRYSIRDKVMQIKNDKKIGVYNGESGVIVKFKNKYDENDKRKIIKLPIVDFDGREVLYNEEALSGLEISNAGTYHKAQGSEQTCTIVVCPNSAAAKRLNTRNLLYTGVTRAKNIIIIVGTKESIEAAVDNIADVRKTGLKDRLAKEIPLMKKIWTNNNWDTSYFDKNEQIIESLINKENELRKKAEDKKNRKNNNRGKFNSSFLKRRIYKNIKKNNEDTLISEKNNLNSNINNNTCEISRKCNITDNEPVDVIGLTTIVEREIPIKEQENNLNNNPEIKQPDISSKKTPIIKSPRNIRNIFIPKIKKQDKFDL